MTVDDKRWTYTSHCVDVPKLSITGSCDYNIINCKLFQYYVTSPSIIGEANIPKLVIVLIFNRSKMIVSLLALSSSRIILIFWLWVVPRWWLFCWFWACWNNLWQFMDNLSDIRLFSMDVRLELGKLRKRDLTDMGKPKVSWHCNDNYKFHIFFKTKRPFHKTIPQRIKTWQTAVTK